MSKTKFNSTRQKGKGDTTGQPVFLKFFWKLIRNDILKHLTEYSLMRDKKARPFLRFKYFILKNTIYD